MSDSDFAAAAVVAAFAPAVAYNDAMVKHFAAAHSRTLNAAMVLTRLSALLDPPFAVASPTIDYGRNRIRSLADAVDMTGAVHGCVVDVATV